MTFFHNWKRPFLLAILCAGLFLVVSHYSSARARDLSPVDAVGRTANIKAVESVLTDVEPAEVATSLATRIDLSAGAASTILTESVAAKEVAHYLVSGERGQELRVALDAVPSSAYFSIYGIQDRQAYKPLSPGATEWSGVLPSDQDYLISVATGDAKANYAIFLELIDLSPFAKLEPAHFHMPSGRTAGVVSGQIRADTPHRYILQADAGQIINFELQSDDVGASFGIQGVADNRSYKWLYDEARAWSFVAPESQDYLLTVATDRSETDYALTVTLP